jgi:hypothetical protein
MPRPLVAVLLFFCVNGAAAELTPETKAAFAKYVEAAEKRMQGSLNATSAFLWLDALLPAEKQKALQQLRAGIVVTDRLEEKISGAGIDVPKGMVHHWVGTVFVPGATVDQTLTLLQDYDQHKNLYKPEVVDSRLISHTGDDFRAFLRFYKKKIIGVTLNTEHEAQYRRLSASRAYSHSHTTKVAEVENAGEKDEHEKAPGKDNGFMWALNSYWRIEERDAGVYVQCEAITLTRSIPALLSPIVKPFVTEVPKESLYTTLNSTRQGLLANQTPSK